MKIKYQLFVVLFILLIASFVINYHYELIAFHPFFEKQNGDLKVLTWNIHCGARTSYEHQQAIAEIILQEDADVVALNEFNLESCMVIDSLLRVRYSYAEEVYAKWNPGDILYCKTKNFNSGHRTIPVDGRSVPNIAMTVVAGNDSVYVMAVHLNSNNDSTSYQLSFFDRVKDFDTTYARYKKSQEGRIFCANYIKEWAQECTHSMIVMGDMNDFSASIPLKIMKEGGLKNSWMDGGFGFGNTYHSGWLGLRIDHILHTERLKLTDARVIDTGDLSDHRPVTASFKIVK